MTMWIKIPSGKKDSNEMELDAIRPAGFARRATEWQ